MSTPSESLHILPCGRDQCSVDFPAFNSGMDRMAAVEQRETAGDPTNVAVTHTLGSSFRLLIEKLGADSVAVTGLESNLNRQTAALAATGVPLREWAADQLTRAAAANGSECGDAVCARRSYVIAALEAALDALRAGPDKRTRGR